MPDEPELSSKVVGCVPWDEHADELEEEWSLERGACETCAVTVAISPASKVPLADGATLLCVSCASGRAVGGSAVVAWSEDYPAVKEAFGL